MQLPIGVSDFRKLIEHKSPKGDGFLYVDKSLFIKEVLYDGSEVIIITRPRRFGKTINLSMLQYFYANKVAGNETANIFKNLDISKHPDCMQYQGKHPVVFISFKDVKHSNSKDCIDKIKFIMSEIYKNFREQLYSDKIPEDEKKYIDLIVAGEPDNVRLEVAIKKLLGFLHTYYGVKPVLLIDEYDTPIQQAYVKEYYDEIILFFRNFLSAALKDPLNLEKGVLTGILRISKESLFSDLNNVKIYSVLHNKYAKWFGFNELEVDVLLNKQGLQTNKRKFKEWFNGYTFGEQLVYNPWSIINSLSENGSLKSYWINTSGNDLIRDLIINASPVVKERIQQLISGGAIDELVDEHIVFGDLNKNTAALWSLMLMSGYLKPMTFGSQGRYYNCKLTIPNLEVMDFYVSSIEEWLSADRGINWYKEFLNDITEGRVEEFEEKLQDLIYETLSYHDTGKNIGENFYHGLMLGIVSGLRERYEIKSNRESGKGRYDAALIPKDLNQNGIILEFKATGNDEKVDEFAIAAYKQIIYGKYIEELKQRGVKNIIMLGIGFSGKEIKVKGSS